jgi:bifunctional UDP-N-acetylglucosamine pyrophosphorylase/glucosamine-1-phosphate N-acetyltransferase
MTVPSPWLPSLPRKRGFGRICKGESGQVLAIIEEAQATPEQLAITELNPGVYCFDGGWLWEALERIPSHPKEKIT